jgi:Uma2 family endonuclease
MSEAEYLALPEVKPYLEYVDGVVLQKPMANAAHGRIGLNLDGHLWLYLRRYGGDAGPERRARLGDTPNYRLPDTSYWAPGRPSGNDSVPTLAVELRSPDQTMDELRAKCRFYRRSGIEVCWLIDPRTRRIEVFEGESDGEPVPPGGKLESPHLPGLTIIPEDVFAGVPEGAG